MQHLETQEGQAVLPKNNSILKIRYKVIHYTVNNNFSVASMAPKHLTGLCSFEIHGKACWKGYNLTNGTR